VAALGQRHESREPAALAVRRARGRRQADTATPGINVNYRQISSLASTRPRRQRRLSLSAGSVRVDGRTLVLQVRNRGNTVDPVGGSVSISGSGSSRSGLIGASPIPPGKRINPLLASLRGLRRGSYRASVTLTRAAATSPASPAGSGSGEHEDPPHHCPRRCSVGTTIGLSLTEPDGSGDKRSSPPTPNTHSPGTNRSSLR
jgi:hypothetical protein